MFKKSFWFGQKSLKFLIGFTAIANIVLSWIDTTFHTDIMYTLFTLSKEGVEKIFLWQPLSYIFINSTHNYGINFSLIFSIVLKSLFLWSVGKKFLLTKGVKHFLSFYFTCSLFIGLTTLGLLYFLPINTMLVGNQYTIYGLFLLSLFLDNNTLPKFVNHTSRTALSIFLILSISELFAGNFLSVFSYIMASIFAYIYLILVFKEHSPIKSLYSFEKTLLKGGNSQTDDQFLEKMLTKISLYGKESLNILEKFRMSRIMRKRKKETFFS